MKKARASGGERAMSTNGRLATVSHRRPPAQRQHRRQPAAAAQLSSAQPGARKAGHGKGAKHTGGRQPRAACSRGPPTCSRQHTTATAQRSKAWHIAAQRSAVPLTQVVHPVVLHRRPLLQRDQVGAARGRGPVVGRLLPVLVVQLRRRGRGAALRRSRRNGQTRRRRRRRWQAISAESGRLQQA